METQIKDALGHIRADVQALHGAISDAASKRGGVIKADIEVIPQKAKTVAESIKSSMSAQKDATKKALAEAVTHLEATQKHASESLKSSGQAFQTSIREALDDTRSAARKVSEAVAAKRSAESTKSPKK